MADTYAVRIGYELCARVSIRSEGILETRAVISCKRLTESERLLTACSLSLSLFLFLFFPPSPSPLLFVISRAPALATTAFRLIVSN